MLVSFSSGARQQVSHMTATREEELQMKTISSFACFQFKVLLTTLEKSCSTISSTRLWDENFLEYKFEHSLLPNRDLRERLIPLKNVKDYAICLRAKFRFIFILQAKNIANKQLFW